MDKHYHNYKRSSTFVKSFLALRKFVKGWSDVRYDNKTYWIGKGNQQKCDYCHKRAKYFYKDCNVVVHLECLKIICEKQLYFVIHL